MGYGFVPGPISTHKHHTVHIEELINRPFNGSDINTRRTFVSHRLTISLPQALRSPTSARLRVQQHRVSLQDAHLCPWSTLFPTRRRSSGGLARTPRSISSAPCRAPTRKTGSLFGETSSVKCPVQEIKTKVGFTRWRGSGDPRRWASLLEPSSSSTCGRRWGCRAHAQWRWGCESWRDTHWHRDDAQIHHKIWTHELLLKTCDRLSPHN